jgi:site-specific DNA-methyltransferase (adenine-specific)
LPKLPDESIDVIFADPDYNVGVKYQGKSYTRNFSDYIDWCVSWAKECHRVLKQNGNMFIINYPKQNAHLRVRYLDSAFHPPNGVREYVWVYKTNVGQGPHHFTTAHRSILHCVKSDKNRFYKEAVAAPYLNPEDKRIKKLIDSGSPGRMPYSWFELNLVKNVGTTKTFHSCQIPEPLSEMLFKASAKKGDIALVLFGGSGSELVVCQRLGLNFISAEIEPQYVKIIEERLKRRGEVPKEYRMLTMIRARQTQTKKNEQLA